MKRRALAAFCTWLTCLGTIALWPARAATLETSCFRLSLSESGMAEILDKRAGVTWGTAAGHARFGEVTLDAQERPRHFDLAGCNLQTLQSELVARFRPVPSQPLSDLQVDLRALADEQTLEVHYQEDNDLELQSICLLENLLAVAEPAKGYVVVPVREGLLVPADSGLSFVHRFPTYAYEGCHMAMLGVVRDGAAALVTWEDPYVTAELKSSLGPATQGTRPQRLAASLVLQKSARTFRIRFLGRGDYMTIAQAYREVAQQRGWLVTWDDKLKTNPERAKLFGAANIKLWSTLHRRMNEASTQEEKVSVNWTFDEAAQVAQHFKQDLGLDKVLFTLGGWIHRGYDNQHPDILPTAPECGGDTAFAACARRVRSLGYLFCLHDNYQDIYRDSPSWDERLIQKRLDGGLAQGGRWDGGRAYLTCSQQAVGLARRPGNLRAVKQLCDADAYFIDTTYAANLQECYDPAHWLTKADDLKWKQELSDYARGVFGIFGSECGREWAIPHSDFFEGLTGVSGQRYHDAGLPGRLGATVVPLFDLVYHDCIAMYGKYGYDPKQAAAYVLAHISLTRPLNYHAIPPHLYWQASASEAPKAAPWMGPDPALFTRADNGWAAGLHPLDRFIKNTYEVLSPLNELTARQRLMQHQFLTPDRKVERTVFGTGTNEVRVVVNASATNYVCASTTGQPVLLPPFGFLAESREFVAFCALSWGGVKYAAPALFTLRSLDGKGLAQAQRVRIFHGFGSDAIASPQGEQHVPREVVLTRP